MESSEGEARVVEARRCADGDRKVAESGFRHRSVAGRPVAARVYHDCAGVCGIRVTGRHQCVFENREHIIERPLEEVLERQEVRGTPAVADDVRFVVSGVRPLTIDAPIVWNRSERGRTHQVEARGPKPAFDDVEPSEDRDGHDLRSGSRSRTRERMVRFAACRTTRDTGPMALPVIDH